MVFTCGVVNADRRAAAGLAKLGPAANKAIADELDLIEKQANPQASIGAEWLLSAYARIEGRGALPRLRRMAANPSLSFLRFGIDNATALALRITSYVSASKTPSRGVGCSRHSEPRHALNQLVLAWLQDDRKQF